ncbi:MAG: DNA-binding response regulator [Chthoniobacterales bacterium]|nr:MAG: DNA-binding response regulator [Chthoniobacterales bacterium]
MTTTTVRILIADDHDVVREGTRAILERQPGWEICGIATTGREAVDLAAAHDPDVVVMDMSMPDLNGLDAARQIKRRRPQTEILIFTAHQTDELVREVFEAGAKSFIFKSDGHIHLVDAVRSLSQHKPYFTNKVSEVLFADILNRSATKPGAEQSGMRLTGREREVVQLLAEGKSNKEVAEGLGISIRTAETHRATVMRKLGLNSVADLVRYAIRNHMIET